MTIDTIELRLRETLSRKRDDVFALGLALSEAREELGVKAFRELLDKLGLGYSAAQQHIRIANDPVLGICTNSANLPPSASTLRSLLGLPAEVIEAEVTPTMTQAQAQALRNRVLGTESKPTPTGVPYEKWDPEPLTVGIRDAYKGLRAFMDEVMGEFVKSGELTATPEEIQSSVMARLVKSKHDIMVNRAGDVGSLEATEDGLSIEVKFYHPEMTGMSANITLSWGDT